MRQSPVRRSRVAATAAAVAAAVAAGVLAGALSAVTGPARPAAAAPAPAGGTSMVVDGTDPLKPKLVLTNNGTAACQIATTALGTLGVLEVVQAGVSSTPIPTDPGFPDAVDAYLTSRLRTLAPGQSATIPVSVLPVGPTGHALESVTWSEQASMGALYPVKAGEPLRVTATYAVPVRPASGPPLCAVAANGGVSAAAPASGGSDDRTLLVVLGAVLLFLLLAALVMLIVLRSRRRRPPPARAPAMPGPAGPDPAAPGYQPAPPMPPSQAGATQPVPTQPTPTQALRGMPESPAAQPPGPGAPGAQPGAPAGPTATGRAEVPPSGEAGPTQGRASVPPAMGVVLVLVAAVAAVGLWARPAFATVSVDPSLSGDFSQCGPLFSSADPAGLFPVLNDPSKKVSIEPANGDQTHEIRLPDGSVMIFWNVDDHHAYTGGGNAEPCSALYHEMYHGKEDLTGGQDHSECVSAAGDSGLPVNEVNATKAENVLRVKEGLPARKTYGDTPLPAGPCLPPDQQPKPKPPCTGAGCGDSNGDPHLLTFDGLRYDFMAAGEFVAARDATGDTFQIQVRQQPIVGSQTVSLNTAVAMAVAGDKVEVDTDLGALALVVNGAAVPVAATTLPGGGTIAVDATAVRPTLDVHWPDGSLAVVSTIGIWGLHLIAQPSVAHAGKVAGLLGNFDGSKAQDLRTSAGQRLPDAPAFGDLYPAYADSWRVTDATSLFTYQNGTHTADYTDRSFPHQPATVDGLPNAVGARALCARLGVTDPVTLANCVLDVAETGQAEFGLAAVATQLLVRASGLAPPSTAPSAPGSPVVTTTPTVGPTTTRSLGNGPEATLTVSKVGGTDRLTFPATAGQRVYVEVLSSDFVRGCGAYLLISPTGSTVDLGCLGDGGTGDMGGDLLPDTGTYAVELRPGDGQTGSMHVRLTFSTDVHGTLAPDGVPTVAGVTVPGQVAVYSFAGTAGERVYVDISGSTLPAGCGVFSLKSPGNGTIDLGCTSDDGTGQIDGDLLKSGGQYTVVVDPPDGTLGQVNLHLITSRDIQGAVTVGGSPVTSSIGTPGQVAFYSFQGTKGQQIKITVTSTSLPGQCGIPELITPDGGTFDEGCLTSGTLTDTLTETGTWRVKIDPPTTETGSVTFMVQPG